MLTYPYNPREHVKLMNELHYWLQSEFPGKKLMVLFHKLYQTFTISHTVKDNQLIDVMNLGDSLGSFDGEKAFILRRLIHGNREYRKELGQALTGNEEERTGRIIEKSGDKSERIARRMSSKIVTGYRV